jgi:hypothetical protein
MATGARVRALLAVAVVLMLAVVGLSALNGTGARVIQGLLLAALVAVLALMVGRE